MSATHLSNQFDPDGRAETDSGIFGLTFTPDESALVLIPVPFDAATSFGRGASLGPEAILAASHQIDLYDPNLGTPYEAGIAMLTPAPEISLLNQKGRELADLSRHQSGAVLKATLEQSNAIGEQVCSEVKSQVSAWLKRGQSANRNIGGSIQGVGLSGGQNVSPSVGHNFGRSLGRRVGTIGGDHSIALGAILAHQAQFPEMAVLHIDAHADLRQAYEGFLYSHASVMFNALNLCPLKKLVQVGVRDLCPGEAQMIKDSKGRIITHFDADLARAAFEGVLASKIIAQIVTDLPKEVYVSFDIDGLDPSLCPNTGTPVPGGLAYHFATNLLSAVTASGRRIVGFDLTEVNPGTQAHEQSWDAAVGAQILYRLCGQTLLKK